MSYSRSVTFEQSGGFNSLSPRIVRMITSAPLATVITAGWYAQPASNNVEALLPSDLVEIAYAQGTSSAATAFFNVSITAGVVTLGLSESTVMLPTIANHIATYTNVSGGLSEDPATAISGGNIQAGLSGTAGAVSSFPSAATSGKLVLAAVTNSSGNFNTTISNAAAVAQSQVVSIPDGGAATSNFILNSGIQQMAAGSEVKLDKGTGTESSHAVTISKQSGVITTTSLTTAQYASETITLTNTLIATTSVVIASIMGGTNTTQGVTVSATAGSGSSTIVLTNTNSSALNGTVIIGFAVF